MRPILGRADAKPSLECPSKTLFTPEAGLVRNAFKPLFAGFEKLPSAIDPQLFNKPAGVHAGFRWENSCKGSWTHMHLFSQLFHGEILIQMGFNPVEKIFKTFARFSLHSQRRTELALIAGSPSVKKQDSGYFNG